MSRTYEYENMIKWGELQGITGSIDYTEIRAAIEKNSLAVKEHMDSVYYGIPPLTLTFGKMISYDHGLTGALAGGTVAYQGAVYDPIQDRIYLALNLQGTSTLAHYIDCDTAKAIQYPKGATTTDFWHFGGAYCPEDGNIHFAPESMSSYYLISDDFDYYKLSSSDPFVNMSNSATGITGTTAYAGAVYSPRQDRTYFVPYSQSTQTYWHYARGGVYYEYAHGATVGEAGSYMGGAYSPSQDRIYFAPYKQGDDSSWHFIDCSDGSVDAYTHSMSGVTGNAYAGAVFSPTQNRIYFIPYAQGPLAEWHYVDCSDGSINAYAHGQTGTYAAVSAAYVGGVYSPATNRIYLVPYTQSNQSYWHYIDCFTGNVWPYLASAGGVGTVAYKGGTYCPSKGRVYFHPFSQIDQVVWHYIQETIAPDNLSKHHLLSPIFRGSF